MVPRLGTNYDVTEDGQRFLVNLYVEDRINSTINVILNWTLGLKR
jgi:hypothetical protein